MPKSKDLDLGATPLHNLQDSIDVQELSLHQRQWTNLNDVKQISGANVELALTNQNSQWKMGLSVVFWRAILQ